MKVGMLTFSQTGNTLKVGRVIENVLSDRGFSVYHTSFRDRKRWKAEEMDIIGIGCPCFESRPAEIVPAFLNNSGFNLKGKRALVYITSSSSPAKTLWRLAQAVERTGAEVLGGVQIRGVSTAPTMFGLTPNRPAQEDLTFAEAFGHAVADNVLSGTELPVCYTIDPRRGSRFYDVIGLWINFVKKKAIPAPEIDHAACSFCGNCIHECPVGNFTFENKAIHVGHNCIVCFRCWHVCPKNAISMKCSPGQGLLERLLWSEKMERLLGELEPGEYRGPNLYKDVLARKVRLKYDRNNPTAEYEYLNKVCSEKNAAALPRSKGNGNR